MPRIDDYFPALDQARADALAYLEALRSDRASASVSTEAIHGRLDTKLPAKGVPPKEVVRALSEDLHDGLMRTSGGRCFAWVIGGTLPAALAADWLTSAWDQNAAASACSPAAAAIESIAGEWVKSLLGLPSSASFAFVTGCQMAHFTCLSAARHRLLSDRGWDVERRGLWQAPPIRVIDTSHRHHTVDRALRFLGVGTDSIEPTQPSGPWSAAKLAHELDRDRDRPTLVLMQAGDIHTGESDDFETLIPIARERGAWVHVDGAFGLWARASDTHRESLAGVERADSWAVDGHKWLNVPYDSGYAIVKDEAAHRAAMEAGANYVSSATSHREPLGLNPELSRRARAFATYAAIRELGREGIERQVDESCRLATSMIEKFGRLPRVDVIRPAVLNQGLVRIRSTEPGASEVMHDEETERTVAELSRRGEAFFQTSRWEGQTVIRVSVCSWQTTPNDIGRTAQAMAEVLDAK